jgi:hypothetical protein
MDRRLEDMEGYYNKPPAKRQAFLDELLAEKVKAPEKAGTTAGMGAKGTGKLPGPKASDKPKQPKQPDKPSDKSDTSLLYEDEEGRQKFEEKKDKFEDDFLDSWTPERKEQWKQFRRAYTERRKQLEAVAGATTAPAGPPAKAPAKTGVAGAAK